MLSNDVPVAIVTGISRGYGRAVAALLLSEGWRVVGNGRDRAKLERTVSDLQAGNRLHPIPGDIVDESHLMAMVQAARALGSLRLVVNNAGILGPSPLPKLTNLSANELAELFRVNTIAQLRLIQLAMPTLKENHGVVINVTSDASVEAYEGWGGYGATKAALDHITRVLAAEHAELRCYALDPGDMRTEMHQAAFPGEDISDRKDPEASAPAVLKLAQRSLESGRYRAEDLMD